VGLSLDLLIRRDSFLTLVNISLGMVPTLMLDVGFLARRMLVSCDANGSSQNVVSPVKRVCGDYVYPRHPLSTGGPTPFAKNPVNGVLRKEK